jgi:hypothetical protein
MKKPLGFINTTPHDINLVGVGTIEPEANADARCEMDAEILQVKPFQIVKQTVRSLTGTKEIVQWIDLGYIVIASAMYCAEFVKVYPGPIYSPGDLVRDNAGRVIGCMALVKWEMEKE